MPFSVIIPSRNVSNLIPCVEAVRRAEPAAEVIVVDDGIDWHSLNFTVSEDLHRNPPGAQLALVALHGDMELGATLGFKIIPGTKPFVFARNVNLGIQACAGDVVLLNDDAILETPFGFHELEEASRAHPEFGVISAVTNVVGNLAQRPRHVGLRAEPRTLAFVCVYVPRATIERIGLLDERFTAYGWEDNDYCRRVREAGLKLGIFDDCFVDHSSLHSTFRGMPRAPGDIAAGRDIYCAKWGDAK